MAKQLNKKLVATLTIAAMLVMAIAAGLLIKTFGGGDPTYFETKAREAAASGDHVRAASLYGKAWRQSKSRQGKYLVWAGEEYLQAGDVPNALRAWEQAILSDPNCVEAHEKKLDHALESYRETDSQKAWQLIDELAGRLLEVTDVAASRPSTDDPARPRITAEEADRLRAKGHYARGLALIALQSQRAQNKEDGIGHLKKACELAPKNADYADALASQYARDAGQAMRRGVEEARQERFRPAVEEFFPKAAQHYRQAAAVYEALLKAAPDNAASHRYYGRFLYSQDRLSSAQIGPLTLPDEVREVLVGPRRYDEALAAIEKAVQISPDVANYQALAEYWVERGVHERAEATATQAATTRLVGIPESCFEKAEAALLKAIEADRGGYTSYLMLGRLYLLQGQVERAAALYDERLNQPLAMTLYRTWTERQGKLRLLEQAFRTALQRLTGDPAADEALLKKATEYYQKAVAEAPGGESDAICLFMNGRLKAARGQYREAEKLYQQAESQVGRADPEIRIHRAEALLRVTPPEVGEAARLLEEVLRDPAQRAGNELAWAMLASALVADASESRLPDAIRAAENAIQIATRQKREPHVLARSAILEAYSRQRNWDRVRELQERFGITRDAGSDQARLAQASLILMRAQSEEVSTVELAEAERELRAVLDKDPLQIRVLQQLHWLLVRQNREAEFQPLLDKAMAAARLPENRARRGIERGLQQLKIATEPGKSEEERYRAAEELIAKGEYEDEFAREVDYVQLHLRQGNRAAARAHVDKALALKPQDPAILDVHFRLAVAEGDEARIADAVRRVREANLDGVGGRFYAGQAAMARKDFATAEREFRAGLEAAGTNSMGYAWLGRALLALERFPEAETALRRAIEINPNAGLAHVSLAQLGELTNRPELVREHLGPATRLMPGDAWVQQKLQQEQEARDPDGAIARREERRKRIPDDPQKVTPEDIQNLLRLAQLYVVKDQHDKADEVLREAVSRNAAGEKLRLQSVPVAYADFLLTRKPQPDPRRGLEVLQEYVRSLSDRQAKAMAQVLVARHLFDWSRMERPDAPTSQDIDAALDAAVNLSPDSIPVLLEVARWYGNTRRLERAEKHYRQAVELAGKDAGLADQERQARRMWIEAVVQTVTPDNPRKDVEGMIDEYEKRFPNEPSAMLLRAQYYLASGRDSEARGLFTRYLEKNPKDPLALYRRGFLALRMGDADAAVADLQQAGTLAPDRFNYQHRLLLARAQVARGRPEAAVSELQSILDQDPRAENVAQEMVELLVSLNRPDEAERRAQQFAVTFSGNPYWPLRIGRLIESRRPASGSAAAEFYRNNGGVIASHYRRAAELGGMRADLVLDLLRVLLLSRRFDEVIEFVQGTLPPDKRIPEHLAAVGDAYAGRGQADRAVREYANALTAARESMRSYWYVLDRMSDSLDMAAAMKLVDERLAAAPGEIAARHGRACLLWKRAKASGASPEAARADLAEAEKILRELIAAGNREADRLEPMRTLVAILQEQKRHQEYAELYRQILKIAPDDVLALNNLAYVLMTEMNKPDEALEYSRRAAQLQVANPVIRANVLDTKGWNLALLGRHEEAIRVLDEAAGYDNRNAAVYLHRALARVQMAENRRTPKEKTDDLRAATEDAQQAHRLLTASGNPDPDALRQCAELLQKLGVQPATRPAPPA